MTKDNLSCPNCGATMSAIKCKLVCLKCRYFQDCGDGMID